MHYTNKLDTNDQRRLLELAAASIQHGLQKGSALPINLNDFSEGLRQHRANFVTLNLDKNLRGCIGSLQATRPWVTDVTENAFAAAFRDPRFKPLTPNEYDTLDIHISTLTAPQAMAVRSEAELLATIRPGIDGLIFEAAGRRSTFLPSVWEQLPQPQDFLNRLRQKAGVAADYWSAEVRIQRYQSDYFGASVKEFR